MAKNQTNNEPSPLGDLRAEAVDHLDAIKGELDEAGKDLEALEKIGLDVSRMRERLDWGYKSREIILERFGKKR